MRFRYVFFDLDGTLTEPFEGITNAVRFALDKMDVPVPDEGTLKKFIGPPLAFSFAEFCGLSKEDAERAVRYYREYYSEKGALENIPYEGILQMLASLKEAGCLIMLATSKPEKFASQILCHFGMMKYFDFVSAPTLSDLHPEKKDIIGRAMEKFGLENEKESCLMIGDRYFDVEGAHLCGISAAGVLWGYGSREEFEEYRAEFVLERTEEIEKVVQS